MEFETKPEKTESGSGPKEKKERNPWIYVSVLLGVLLVVSMGFNRN